MTNQNQALKDTFESDFLHFLEHRFEKQGVSDAQAQCQQLTQKSERLFVLGQAIGLDEAGLQAAYWQSALPLSRSEEKRLGQSKTLSSEVFELLVGVQKMAHMSMFSSASQGEVSDENLRKMLIAMVNDVRVVLLKLADQVDVLRQLKTADEQTRRATAQLTLDVYARLANRLGVWYLKWELEDYSLRYLDEKAYKEIAQELGSKREQRELFIEQFTESLGANLKQSDLNAKVYGRPKHIYSIWKKMQNKGLAFDNIMDIRAVRILVDSISDCYTALGVVHTSWRHLPGEFDDYIATPKPNGYQSIHTAVIGPKDKVVEVQIRTHEMHEENELGVAAHWRYKEGPASGADSIDDKIQWLRQLLEWKDDLTGGKALPARFDAESENERVFVFSPKGRVIDLTQGATPIDFAYSIHTEVGHRTRGARIHNKMVPLNTALKTGDQVEIITSKEGKPSRDWIALPGYVQTAKAKASIQHWFKLADHDTHVALGRDHLDRELKRFGLHEVAFDKIAQENRYDDVEAMMTAIGAGDVTATKLLTPFRQELTQRKAASTNPARSAVQPSGSGEIQVKGVAGLETFSAKCCNPLPGEAIIGFITRGRGVSIHQQGCVNIQHLNEDDYNRLIDVEWSNDTPDAYSVDVLVVAYNRSGLLHDVTKVLNDSKITINKAQQILLESDSIAQISFNLDLPSVAALVHVLSKVNQVPNVFEVKRI